MQASNQPEDTPIPQHIAIIMDGNRRWAKSLSLPVALGHASGARRVRGIVQACADRGVRFITLFAFSTENWSRPPTEISSLMGLLSLYLQKEVNDMNTKGVCLKVVGDTSKFTPRIQALIRDAEANTAHNTTITLTIAFHYYDQHRNRVIRALLARKHPALIRRAALVVAGNAYLADFARVAGARQVELVPTVINLERYPLAASNPAKMDGPPCVGWIGQRATAGFLAPYAPLFGRLSADGLARFTAIGIDAQSLGLPMASIPWSEQTEVASIKNFDIGIMPLLDAAFERGKCGYKLIQYMACGLPVVASPVGVNRQIVEHGVNGFLAETPEQWEQALKTLLSDPDLRQRMGRAGRQKVEQEYCIQVTGPRMAALLLGAVNATQREN